MTTALTEFARRMFSLGEPIAGIPFNHDEPSDAVVALDPALHGYWDAYFAGRSAPLGSSAPAELVHAVFYNFGPGEVARHIPKVWSVTTPEKAWSAWQHGAAAALRRILGDAVEGEGLARAAELATRAATGAPLEGRPMYAALRALPVPDEPATRLWHALNLLREHRGDGHVAALVAEGIGGLECHILVAVDLGMPGEKFGRVHHLPPELLDSVIGGLRDRGQLDGDGRFTAEGRATKDRIEALTDRLATPPYERLTEAEREELVATLEPLSEVVAAASVR